MAGQYDKQFASWGLTSNIQNTDLSNVEGIFVLIKAKSEDQFTIVKRAPYVSEVSFSHCITQNCINANLIHSGLSFRAYSCDTENCD